MCYIFRYEYVVCWWKAMENPMHLNLILFEKFCAEEKQLSKFYTKFFDLKLDLLFYPVISSRIHIFLLVEPVSIAIDD